MYSAAVSSGDAYTVVRLVTGWRAVPCPKRCCFRSPSLRARAVYTAAVSSGEAHAGAAVEEGAEVTGVRSAVGWNEVQPGVGPGVVGPVVGTAVVGTAVVVTAVVGAAVHKQYYCNCKEGFQTGHRSPNARVQ